MKHDNPLSISAQSQIIEANRDYMNPHKMSDLDSCPYKPPKASGS